MGHSNNVLVDFYFVLKTMYYGDHRANSGKVPHSRAHWCWERLMISVHYGWLLNQWPPEYWPTSRSEAVEHCSVFCQEQKELCKIKWAPGWTAVTASSELNGLRLDWTDWVIQKRKSAGCFGKKVETHVQQCKFVMWLAILSRYNYSLAHTYVYIYILLLIFLNFCFKITSDSYISRWWQVA